MLSIHSLSKHGAVPQDLSEDNVGSKDIADNPMKTASSIQGLAKYSAASQRSTKVDAAHQDLIGGSVAPQRSMKVG